MSAAAPCGRCGSETHESDLRCATCGLPTPVTATPSPRALARILRCDGCGAAVTYDVAARAPTCGFCGNVTRVEQPEDPLEEPEGWLPFRVDHHEARAALSRWQRSLGWFRPGDLAERAAIDSLRPLWWCAWVVDADVTVSWAADSDVGSARSASWSPHAGVERLEHRDLVIAATRGLRDDECQALGPRYDLGSARPEPESIPGAVVERFEVQRSEARARVAEALINVARHAADERWVPGKRRRNVHVEVLIERLATSRLGLPAHVLAWRYRGRTYRSVVHGQDASLVVGTAPISPWRVAAVALGCVVGVAAAVAAVIALT